MPEHDKLPQRPLSVRAWIPACGVDAQVVQAIESLLAEYDDVLRIDDWPDFRAVSQLAETMLHAEASHTHAATLRDGSAARRVRDVALPGVVIPHAWLSAARAERTRRVRDFVNAQLANCDLFLLPALADPVPDRASVTPGHTRFEARKLMGLYRFMGCVNYLGLPAVVFPIAADAHGMPICVQLVARPFHEHRLLAFADAVQSQRFDGKSFTRRFQTGN